MAHEFGYIQTQLSIFLEYLQMLAKEGKSAEQIKLATANAKKFTRRRKCATKNGVIYNKIR
jgi:hypothetical protein